MDEYEILVLILATALAIFLILAIALTIILIRIFRRIDSISKKAEHFADTLEGAGEFFKNAAAPVAAAKMVSNIIEWARKPNKKKGD